MQPEQVLEHPSCRLNAAERQRYFDDGFVAVPSAISSAWIDRLRHTLAQALEDSRAHSVSDDKFLLEEGHSAERPRLHRLISPEDHYAPIWEFMACPEMTALAADVVGPDVKFHHAKLNFKSARGSRGCDWHQDIQSWPHTDYSPVTIGVYIDGCTDAMGPLSILPGSHDGPLFSMYDEAGDYAVRVRDDEVTWNDDSSIAAPTGPPGTLVLLPDHSWIPDQPIAAQPTDVAGGLF